MAGFLLRLLATALLAFTFVVPTPLRAQSSNVQFQRFAFEEGLTDYAVTSVFQDSSDFLWVGTQGTLFRYDGREFEAIWPTLADKNIISTGYVYTIEGDREGHIWIGTRMNGANRYDPRSQRFYYYTNDPADSTSLSDNGVRAIHEDRSGRLWLGTREGVLNEFDAATGSFKRYYLPSDSTTANRDIFAIYEAPSEPGTLWIGRADGLFRFDPNANHFTPYRHNPNDASSLSDNTVYAIFEDRNRSMWIGTSKGGLNRFDRATASFTAYRHDPKQPHSLSDDDIFAIIQGPRHTLWVGTNGGGLNKFDPYTGQAHRYVNAYNDPKSLSHDIVTALATDQTNQLWVGTFVGLNRYNPARERITYFGHEPDNPNSLSHPEVLCLIEDRAGIVWIGTQDGGLNRLDRRTGQFRHYLNSPNSPYKRINTIFEDQQGLLWIGTRNNQFHQFDPATGRLTSITVDDTVRVGTGTNTLQSIYESPRNPGILWIGTSHSGLYWYDTQTRQLKNYYHKSDDTTSLSYDYIWQTYEDRQGLLWVTTMGGGINRFDPVGETFIRYQHDLHDTTTVSSNNITSIAEGPQGQLWFGTFDNGLNKFDRATERFTRYNQDNDFPFLDIGGILFDGNGFLWISSTEGLFKFDPVTETVVKFSLVDGLQGNLFRFRGHYKNTKGEFYFGGIKGFNVFYPDSVRVNRRPPSVVLSKFMVNDEPHQRKLALTVAQDIELQHDQNFLSFEFAALDFTEPSRNEYSHKMVGVDEDWRDIGNRHVVDYPKLAPGVYTFLVRGSNNHGIWNEERASLRIVIAPPWWRTWWFYTLVIAAMLALVTGAYRYRVAKLLEIEQVENQKRLALEQMRHQTELDKEQMQHQNELEREQMRTRIAVDLHDELGGKLSGIAMLAERVYGRAKLVTPDGHRLRQISNTARHMVDELRMIVWFIRPEYDKLDNVVSKMQNVTATMLGEINHSFHYPEEELGKTLSMEFRWHFLLCYQEILHNIIRHAHAENVKIRLERKADKLILTVADDGVGFGPETIADGDGLNNLSQRAGLMNGEVHISSQLGEGTTVTLVAKIT